MLISQNMQSCDQQRLDKETEWFELRRQRKYCSHRTTTTIIIIKKTAQDNYLDATAGESIITWFNNQRRSGQLEDCP